MYSIRGRFVVLFYSIHIAIGSKLFCCTNSFDGRFTKLSASENGGIHFVAIFYYII